jgi:hypothetical protein
MIRMFRNIRTVRTIGISLPENLYKHIDDVKGDIPRSIFVKRLIEESLARRGLAMREGGGGKEVKSS